MPQEASRGPANQTKRHPLKIVVLDELVEVNAQKLERDAPCNTQARTFRATKPGKDGWGKRILLLSTLNTTLSEKVMIVEITEGGWKT